MSVERKILYRDCAFSQTLTRGKHVMSVDRAIMLMLRLPLSACIRSTIVDNIFIINTRVFVANTRGHEACYHGNELNH